MDVPESRTVAASTSEAQVLYGTLLGNVTDSSGAAVPGATIEAKHIETNETLRTRSEDIPALAQHFVRKFSRQMGKRIETIPSEIMEVLKLHDWPSNIRELENFIARAVIMSTETVLPPPKAPCNTRKRSSSPRSGARPYKNELIVKKDNASQKERNACARASQRGNR